MSRFVGIKNSNICIVSDKYFDSEGIRTVELPIELREVDPSDLIINYKLKNNQVVHKRATKKAKDLKVALVGNWKMQCGIATYSNNLWTEVAKNLGDFKLFIEEDNFPLESIYQMGDKTLPVDKVSVCWKRGNSLQKLISEIKQYDPDIVWIQHEFGLWPNAGYWLSLMNQLAEYRIIVTMHSVFHHRDKTIVEAAMPEIVTHLQGGYDVLKNEKQVPGSVHVIPHGCFPCNNKEKLWNFYKSNRTFMQFGFGFRYKGWENAIKAAAILKEKFSDVFFTGLFSESPYNKVEHQLYYTDLMELVHSLNLQENVAIIRGFQSEATLDSYMRTNQATIFPYVSHPAHEVYGASGAARIAMSKAVPVVTSAVNHFSDIPSVKANTPEELAAALENLFENPKIRHEQINKQIAYINETTWEKVAAQYIKLFENP
jgi:glycosyltransferase involved in cell wall biosynthesis